MDNLDTFLRAIKKLEQIENIEEAVEDDNGINTISSSSPEFMNIANDKNIELLSEVELAASFFLFDDVVTLNKQALRVLNKNGIEVITLKKEFEPFTHAIKTDKFHILINY